MNGVWVCALIFFQFVHAKFVELCIVYCISFFKMLNCAVDIICIKLERLFRVVRQTGLGGTLIELLAVD